MSSTGIKAVRTFEYLRNEQRIGTELISTCAISESILVNEELDLGTRTIAEIDCNWTPSCYKENQNNSGNMHAKPKNNPQLGYFQSFKIVEIPTNLFRTFLNGRMEW